MRIGLVCPYNIFRGGGVQECVLALQTELMRRGHTVVILTPQSKEARDRQLDNVVFLGGGTEVKSPFHTSAQISVSANVEALQQALDTHKFDILHFHEPWVPILSRQLLTRSKAINIATFHAKLPDTIMSKTIERVITPYTKSILKYLDAFSAVSDAAASYVQTLTPHPITIVPNGIDLQKYHSSQNNSSRPGKTILYIGRLERRKGVKYLLRAFALLNKEHENLQLVIAGDGPDRQKLELLAKELKLSNVNFRGFVSEAEKLSLFAEADAFCSPALYGESFGIVLLEAMAMGTVISAGDNPGYASVMKDAGVMSLINPKDTAAFARQLHTLLYFEKIRQVWREWAEQYVQQFDYPKIVDQYEALYKNAKKRT